MAEIAFWIMWGVAVLYGPVEFMVTRWRNRR